MEQNKRDRRAWIAAIVLAPLLIYLLAVNVFKVGQRSSPPASKESARGMQPAAPPLPAPASPASIAPPEPSLDPQRAAEQRRIADRLPRRNPFSATVESPAAAAYRPAAAAGPAKPADAALKVTAFMSRGAKRMAMINGQMLGEGDRIGEWTILKVNQQNVLLDNGTRQMVVGPK